MMQPSPSTLTGPASLLAGARHDRIEPREDLRGFGGLHGGLTLALLAAAMSTAMPDLVLRSITGRFHRGIHEPAEVTLGPWTRGRTVAMGSASAATTLGVGADAVATFGTGRGRTGPRTAPPVPPAPPPDDCEVFTIPVEFVPVTQHLEIRPVGPNRPFAAGAEPTLTAWVRLVEDDAPPDAGRFVMLADALAPSWSSVLDTLVPVPTLEMTVRPGDGLARAHSPWVLLHAATRRESAGWVDELIDGWGPDGEHLGSAHQLRLVLSPADDAADAAG